MLPLRTVLRQSGKRPMMRLRVLPSAHPPAHKKHVGPPAACSARAYDVIVFVVVASSLPIIPVYPCCPHSPGGLVLFPKPYIFSHLIVLGIASNKQPCSAHALRGQGTLPSAMRRPALLAYRMHAPNCMDGRAPEPRQTRVW